MLSGQFVTERSVPAVVEGETSVAVMETRTVPMAPQALAVNDLAGVSVDAQPEALVVLARDEHIVAADEADAADVVVTAPAQLVADDARRQHVAPGVFAAGLVHRSVGQGERCRNMQARNLRAHVSGGCCAGGACRDQERPWRL